MDGKKLYLYALVFLIYGITYGQILPPIQNYKADQYNAGNQNWSVTQTTDKHIHLANNKGLLSFNGIDWCLSPTSNTSIMRSVYAVGDTIYSGSYMDFGYWVKDEYNSFVYTSLIQDMSIPLIFDEQFWAIEKIDQWLFFQSLDRIYIYDTTKKTIEFVDTPSFRALLFKVNKSIYFQLSDFGLYTIKNKTVTQVIAPEKLGQNEIVGMFDLHGKNLIITKSGSIYEMNDEALILKHNISNQQLKEISIYSTQLLSDDSIALGSISNGLFILNLNNNITQISRKEGINNNTVLSLFEDSSKNLWLALDNGISVINRQSPFSVYNDYDGKLGTVYAAHIVDNGLYLGTNQGLFFKSDAETKFKLIPKTEGQVWHLSEHDNQIFCGHHEGTFIIKNGLAEKIPNTNGTWLIKSLPDQNLLLQGTYKGINILEKLNGQWQLRNTIKGFDISSRFIEFISPYKLLMNHEYIGVYYLELNHDYTSIIDNKKITEGFAGSSIVKYNDTIYLNTQKDILKYDPEKNKFIKDKAFTDNIISKNDSIIRKVIVESDKLWVLTNNNIINISRHSFNNSWVTKRIPTSIDLDRSLGISSFETLTSIDEIHYLIGTSNGYILFNDSNESPKNHSISIDRIESFSDDITERKLLQNNELNAINNADNNLIISFSTPEYDKYAVIDYEYKVEGLFDEWKSTHGLNQVILNDIPWGKYKFIVRSSINHHWSEETDGIHFKIKRPFSLTNGMLGLYLILAIGSFFLINHLYNRRFRKKQRLLMLQQERELEHNKLEANKQMIEIKNKQLKAELDSKNRELTTSSMSIIRKNKLLNHIKKELLDKNNNNRIGKVIDIIDDNLNIKKDWNVIEKAINDADKDFFKKLKKLHPNLSPNDLRFCAFLRLNLSSKEIAPLLNISARSVEIKRYRLRKKMDLEHETNLVDYILGI